MERIVSQDLTDHLTSQGLLSEKQHGFIKGRSTLTNLLESVSDWTLALDNKRTTSVIYIDFSRAFDMVSHPKLLSKLRSYNISGDLLCFITDFLSNRSQRTRVGNSLSEIKELISGVIQGSCLGPLLFLLYVNDVTRILDNCVEAKLYADDIKLYTHIETIVDEFRLQNNLNKLVKWAEAWQLSVSYSKCAAIDLGISKKNASVSTSYFIGNHRVVRVALANDLGVTVDEQLHFTKHINIIARKAHTRCSLILKCFQSKNVDCLLRAYLTYVRPTLEYNSPVWNPHFVKDIRTLESVQRRFTKKLNGLHDLTYEQRLQVLNLDSLEVRRIRADLVLTFKIIRGISRVKISDFFTVSTATKTRGHCYKLSMPKVRTDIRKYFLVPESLRSGMHFQRTRLILIV